jgi:5'-deoxynucleotidase YfbR-like HD superfamily hydrolase
MIQKKEREESSRLRIEKEFPEFKEFHETIVEYEQQDNEESRFVYVLDKLHPVFQVYLDGGRDWEKHEITLEMLIDKKAGKAALSKDLFLYWSELLSILKEKESVYLKSKF